MRVAENVAGANWGSHFTPRLGQEVLIGFIGGDIDRPVVMGVLYNGVGQANAQSNQTAAGAATATGNAPPWFPGEQAQGKLQGHKHPAVLAGYRSQELATSQSGTGGYNQLVLDDTPGAGRLELASSSAQTRLQLGHLLNQSENRRLQARGHGLDLATSAWGALRAGSGMLISAQGKPASIGNASQMDLREPKTQLEQSTDLAHSLAESAQKQNAKLTAEPDTVGAKKADTPKQLSFEQALHASQDSVSGSDTLAGAPSAGAQGADASSIGGGAGSVPTLTRPDLVLAAPGGIGSFTPAHAVLSAGNTASQVAGQDLHQLAQANMAVAVKSGVIFYTYGKATNTAKPNTETGIQLHAASGNVQTQSQTAATHLTADKAVHVASTNGMVRVTAPSHILLTAAGAAIRIEGGNITLNGPGKVEFKAGMKELGAGKSASASLNLPRIGPMKPTDMEFRRVYADGSPIAGIPYKATFADGTVRTGATDANGLVRLAGVPAGTASVVYGLDPNAPKASIQMEVDDDFQRLIKAGA